MPSPENTTGESESEAHAPKPLFVPVPHGLAELLGYGGSARYVGMFWSHEANEVVLTDGRERRTGESLRFLEYFGHQAVESELGDLNIGLFDETATMWLLLDTLADNLYYASAPATQEFLAKQHASEEMEGGGLELRQEMEAVFDEIDPALEELRAYLDAFTGTSDRQ